MPWRQDATNAGFCPDNVEPWLPVDRRHLLLAVDRQQADPESMLVFTRRFLAWRKRHPALIRGDIRFLDLAEPLLGFERTAGAECVLCVFNLSGEEHSFRLHAAASIIDEAPGVAGSVSEAVARLPAWGAVFARRSRVDKHDLPSAEPAESHP